MAFTIVQKQGILFAEALTVRSFSRRNTTDCLVGSSLNLFFACTTFFSSAQPAVVLLFFLSPRQWSLVTESDDEQNSGFFYLRWPAMTLSMSGSVGPWSADWSSFCGRRFLFVADLLLVISVPFNNWPGSGAFMRLTILFWKRSYVRDIIGWYCSFVSALGVFRWLERFLGKLHTLGLCMQSRNRCLGKKLSVFE